MSRATAGASSSARLGVVLFALAALTSFGIGLTFAAPPFTATIGNVDVSDHTVTITGTADSPSHADHHMVIAWGDGDVDVLPDFATSPGPWNWGPVSHTYDADGAYTITATLIHSQNPGADQGSDTADVTVGGPCTDCPSDDGGTDDGIPTEVLPKVIKKKPLAKTGPETAGLTVFALVLLMAGATIRMIATGDEAVATAGAHLTHADVIRQAISRRSRDRKCNG